MRTRLSKINIITLGCAKNIYDSEILISQLRANSIEVEHESEKNDSRIEEAQITLSEMPEVPDPLPAPQSLGGLTKHISEDEESEESTGFDALSERADELSEEIEERAQIVKALLEDEVDEEDEIEKEV